MRREEIVKVLIDNVDLVKSEVLIDGKGRLRRLQPIPPGTVEILRLWMDASVKEWDKTTFLFPGRSKGGLTPEAVFYICKRRAVQAGIKDFSPHDLRRSYASDLFDLGEDARTVQRLLGHRQVNTVERYDLRGRNKMKGAAKKIFVPVPFREGK